MLKNYLRIAWRNLFRNRTLSLINLMGLSISIAFCVLLFLDIRYEQSFDRFHARREQLYRVEMSPLFEIPGKTKENSLFGFLTRGDDQNNDLEFPLITGPDMASRFPEVKQFIRFKDGIGQLVRVGASVYKTEQTVFADPGFFTELSFPLLKGNARTALSLPDDAVLSASTARKYFGDKDPIGKTIQLISDSTRLFKVTGVAADAPANSSIQYSVIIPLTADPDYAENIKQRFNHMSHLLLIELKPGVNEKAFEAKLNKWMKEYFLPSVAEGFQLNPQQVAHFHWYLRRLADCHYNVSGEWGHFTDAKAIYELASIVVVILLLASLNYVLITVSNAAARSQEVGVRKVLGAGRRAIILQSWVETQLMVAMSVVVGVGLAYLGVPLLHSVIDSGVSYGNISWTDVLAAGVALALGLGLLAGYYPALLISRLKPLAIIKSYSTFRIHPRFSRALVVVQFTSCVVLMMAAFVISRQMAFISNKDLGFDKEGVLMVHNPSWDSEFSQHVRTRLYAFAATQPSIISYSAMTGDLMGRVNTNGFFINGEHHTLKQLSVDYHYFDLLGLKFVTGRGFSPAFPTDSSKAVRACVVNETLFRMLGPRVRLGVFDSSLRQTIVGVVKDYNFERLTKKIEPELHRMVKGYCGDFLFRVRAGSMRATIAALESEWKGITNNYPFDYSFLDESIAQMYATDMRWQKAMTISCVFAILIACMGLFGLAAINAANRTKEIGIRKVLGADVGDLVTMLSLAFLRMVFIAVILATPVAWWMMNRWLEDFAFRIDIRWWMFAEVGATALAIALGTVSWHVWRAARANPVEALRAE